MKWHWLQKTRARPRPLATSAARANGPETSVVRAPTNPQRMIQGATFGPCNPNIPCVSSKTAGPSERRDRGRRETALRGDGFLSWTGGIRGSSIGCWRTCARQPPLLHRIHNRLQRQRSTEEILYREPLRRKRATGDCDRQPPEWRKSCAKPARQRKSNEFARKRR